MTDPFSRIAVKRLFFIVLALAALSTYAVFRFQSAVAQTLPLLLKQARSSPLRPTEMSGEQDKQDIESLVAVMGDEQVRRLLIDELKTRAAREQLASTENNEIGGIAGFIHRIKNRISFIRERIEDLKTSDGVDIQEEFPAIYKYMGDGEKTGNPARAVWSVFLVFAGAMLLDWVFRRYLLSARKQIVGTVPPVMVRTSCTVDTQGGFGLPVHRCFHGGRYHYQLCLFSRYPWSTGTRGIVSGSHRHRPLVCGAVSISFYRRCPGITNFAPFRRRRPIFEPMAAGCRNHQQFWSNDLRNIASGRHA